ncbi:hypothetical protein [Poseidonocella sp. HB161398]|uniref:hypothetical protein n=1 Tax=Poseidonocella sp. HB161398 TaxID=2320855 RepID=UPI0011095F31|nr:hypothetical protein [Poseidonocella sp. HB161398]
MIELAFVICLAASPGACREESKIYVDLPLRACLLRGQAELARWSGTHPGWLIRRWSCRPLGAGAARL